MKKQTETGEIISIDLDEEKVKEEKQQQVEITAGEMYLRIPADRSRIKEAIAFLQVFEQKLPRQKEIDWENPTREQPTYKDPLNLPKIQEQPLQLQINKEIQKTKQLIAETEQQQRQIEAGFPFKNPVMPQFMPIQTPQENMTTLDQHPIFDKCPKCGSRIKKKKIEMASDGFLQRIVCKNRKCGWEHSYKIKL